MPLLPGNLNAWANFDQASVSTKRLLSPILAISHLASTLHNSPYSTLCSSAGHCLAHPTHIQCCCRRHRLLAGHKQTQLCRDLNACKAKVRSNTRFLLATIISPNHCNQGSYRAFTIRSSTAVSHLSSTFTNAVTRWRKSVASLSSLVMVPVERPACSCKMTPWRRALLTTLYTADIVFFSVFSKGTFPEVSLAQAILS